MNGMFDALTIQRSAWVSSSSVNRPMSGMPRLAEKAAPEKYNASNPTLRAIIADRGLYTPGTERVSPPSISARSLAP